MTRSKTRIDYWRERPTLVRGPCWYELDRADVEDGWHRSVTCAKVARFSISFPGADHAPVLRCREHKEELLEFNPRAVPVRL